MNHGEVADETMTANGPLQVKCAACQRRYGRATLLGELIGWPDGRWSWHAARRAGYGDEREVSIRGLPTFGGVEARCRRCGHRVRFRPSKLAREADTPSASAALII